MEELEEAVVLKRSRASSLSEVRSLQCWGMSIERLSVLAKLANIEILNLSCNSISSLDDLRHCKQLRQLFLRKNNITNIDEVCHLQDLPHLEDMWLAGNPITSLPNYRTRIIQLLPQLSQLDGVTITTGERALADVGSTQHRAKLCAAVLSILPLLDPASLVVVQQSVDSLINIEQLNNKRQ